MNLRTRRLLAATSILGLIGGLAACTAEVDEDGARVDVEDDGDTDS